MLWKAVVAACLLQMLLGPEAQAEPPLFGTAALERNDLRPFPKWTEMLKRHERQLDMRSGECQPSGHEGCPSREWLELIRSVQPLPFEERLDAVNDAINSYRYRVDQDNWGKLDFWATPLEFLQRGGDCEDYAVAKMMTLKLSGLDQSKMRVVVVYDLNLRSPHAVLAVYTDDRILILDNQIRRVVEARRIRHYRAIYSINEQAWWLHTYR